MERSCTNTEMRREKKSEIEIEKESLTEFRLCISITYTDIHTQKIYIIQTICHNLLSNRQKGNETQTADLFHLNHIESIIVSSYEVTARARTQNRLHSILMLFYCFYDDDDDKEYIYLEHWSIDTGSLRLFVRMLAHNFHRKCALSMVLNCKQMAQVELEQL